MAFTRQFTEQEVQVLDDVQATLIVRGIQMKQGERYAEENAQMLVSWFDKNVSVPVTLGQVLGVANLFVSKLHYVSPVAAEFNQLLVKLSQDEVENLQDFLRRYSLVQIDGTTGGFKNSLLLVGWLRRYGYAITIPNLATAMEGFRQSTDPRQQLSWVERVPTEPKRYGKHSGEDDPNRKPGELFNDDKDRSREWVNGKRNHSFGQEQQKPVVSSLDSSEEAFKKSALAVINNGRTHSQKTERQEAFDQELVKTGSYRLAWAAAQAVAKQHEARGY